MRNKIYKSSFLLCLLIILGSCDYINLKQYSSDEKEEEKTPIARVKNSILYLEDLKGIVSKETSSADSANIMNRYVNSWVKKQLLINEASEKINFDVASIDRKVLDYKYALMVHEYKKYYVDQKLDTSISESEIQKYYEENKSNFELKQNIIRGHFIKIAKNAPKIKRLKSLVTSTKESDMNELKSYCFRYAETYFLEDSVWINFDEVIRNTPFVSVTNKVQFLKTNNYVEEEDDKYLYILKIKEYKISDQISPLEFVRNDINQIILNKRKVAIANQLEEDVFEKAQQANKYEIYN
ncbi:peptidyl-prolyl cis-trans isomerase [Marivirga lumbricoides]|uniref:peptidyl-prolyl cis-trans isomerase n=1 Tax=Marivirga lumbricoides TaxID=1046115 RepID=UPI001E3CC541